MELDPFWVLLGLHAPSHSVILMACGRTEAEVMEVLAERQQLVRDEDGLDITASDCRAFNLTRKREVVWGQLRYWLAENLIVGAEAATIIRAVLLEIAESLREAKGKISDRKK